MFKPVSRVSGFVILFGIVSLYDLTPYPLNNGLIEFWAKTLCYCMHLLLSNRLCIYLLHHALSLTGQTERILCYLITSFTSSTFILALSHAFLHLVLLISTFKMFSIPSIDYVISILNHRLKDPQFEFCF
jgi:hypothetical protein